MRRVRTIAVGLALGLAVPALAATDTVSVPAQGQTVPVGTEAADAADDPAIWRNPRNPEASLIVATDKKAGLYVYGLDGAVRHFQPGGRLNNVDLLDMGRAGLIVVASDRNDETQARLQIFRLETSAGALIPLGSVAGGTGEAYGLCLYRQGTRLQAFSVLKHGAIEQIEIDLSASAPSGRTLRSLKLATQTEGCVVDKRQNKLYVGEEARGIWQFDARASGSEGGKLVVAVDGKQLVADMEGLALMPSGRKGGWLIASSQGDNAYALYRLPGLQPAGRFRIAGGTIGSTEETDGIDLARGSFGPGYPGGLFVAQDGVNAPHAQNFKLVSWQAIVKALRKAAKR
jgi:3-phytase